jgi:hypothetical protein
MGTTSDSQKVDLMNSKSPQLYLRSFIVVSVFVSTLDKKYSGLPVASMKIGSRMCFNTVADEFDILAVTEAFRAAEMLSMLKTYEMVVCVKRMLKVVIRLS